MSPLLSLRDPEEDEDERRGVESATRPSEKRSDTARSKGLTIEPEGTGGGEGSQ